MEQIGSPDVLADGSHQLDLPTIPNCESEAILATGSVLNGQEALPGECEEFEVPEGPPRKCRKVHGRRMNICDLPYLRTSALLDIPTIAMKLGEYLLSVPTSWLDEANAHRWMAACGMATTGVLQCFLLEILAGCGHLSQASREAGLATGPIHRQIASRWQKLCGTGLVDAGGSSRSVCYVDNVASDVYSPRLS